MEEHYSIGQKNLNIPTFDLIIEDICNLFEVKLGTLQQNKIQTQLCKHIPKMEQDQKILQVYLFFYSTHQMILLKSDTFNYLTFRKLKTVQQ